MLQPLARVSNQVCVKSNFFFGFSCSEYDAVSRVTVCLKHQEPLSQHSVILLKTWIISNAAGRTSILQILSTLSSDCSSCHSLYTNVQTCTHAHCIDPSSIQGWLEYEFGHKQYWTVIRKLCNHIHQSLWEYVSSVWEWEVYTGRHSMSTESWDIVVVKFIKGRNRPLCDPWERNTENAGVADSFEVLHSNC
jgi:hypothetical protein